MVLVHQAVIHDGQLARITKALVLLNRGHPKGMRRLGGVEAGPAQQKYEDD